MKVLLCCAGGLSSSILMKKMKTWADAHGEDLEIQAMGTGEAVETWQNGYECVLLAPPVSYRLKQLQEEIKLPIAEVPSLDYEMCIRDRAAAARHRRRGHQPHHQRRTGIRYEAVHQPDAPEQGQS